MTVLTFGETMALASAMGTGPLAHTATMQLGIGGSESNVAIGLRRLGVDVTWVGRVGADSLGDRVERELRAEGLVVHAVRDSSAPTGLMVKERRTSSATRVWYYRSGSSGSRLETGDVPECAWADISVLHVTGITPALSESAAKATLHYVEQARERGIAVSFDLNYRNALWTKDTAAPMYRQIIALSDVVFAGADEAAIVVSGGSPHELAEQLSALGPSEVVIKLGADGAVARVDGQVFEAAAVPVVVVDSVGAGDGFVAGYLAERLAGRPVTDRLALAVRVGAFACTVSGDWEGLPRREELKLLHATEGVSR